MKIATVMKALTRLSSAGVDLSFLDSLLADEKLQSALATWQALKDHVVDPEDPASIAGLLSIFGIDLPPNRVEAIRIAFQQQGVEGTAWSELVNGKLLRAILWHDADGYLKGDFEQDSDGEWRFNPISPLLK